MLKINEYFEGKVKSIALENSDGSSTVGVISIGEYEFGTSTKEHMHVISGTLDVLLPESKTWKMYKAGDMFRVDKDKKFKVKASEPVAYLCYYK
jgi:uncharacterized protein YaiE (UPF0345 family)